MAGDQNAKERDDLVAMTEQQEKSKAVLDGLRMKLSSEITEKVNEMEKLQEEKGLAEKERDEALQSSQELQADLDRVQKASALKQKEMQD
jgi:hypothetical protein